MRCTLPVMRILALLFSLLAAPAFACGPDSDCVIGDRSYRISLPQSQDGAAPAGALIWSHGYRGSAAGVMRNRALRRVAAEAGLALIAVQGVNGSWNLPNGPRTMDSTGAAEFAYFDAVIADAVARFDIDPARVVASGFSAGGMMVWYLACLHPEPFAAFVPFSGTYWKEPPADCTAPARSIVHVHGDADRTVPLNGRPIGGTHQGRVMDALTHYRRFGNFGNPSQSQPLNLSCETRANAPGGILEYCLFPGGHSFSTKHLGYALKRLKAKGQL